MNRIEEKLTEKLKHNNKLKISKDLDLFFVVRDISIIEGKDNKFSEFLEYVENNEEEVMNNLVFEKIPSHKNREFRQKLLELIKYFYYKFDNIDNIIHKKYNVLLYLHLKMKEQEFTKIRNNKLTIYQRKPEFMLFFNIAKMVDSYIGDSEFENLSQKCLEIIENISNIPKYDWKNDFIELIQESFLRLKNKRDEIEQEIKNYDLFMDTYIIVIGNAYIKYIQSMKSKIYSFKYILNKYEKIFQLKITEKMSRIIKDIDSCEGFCDEIKKEISDEINSIVEVFNDVRFNNKQFTILTKRYRNSIKRLEMYLEKEHQYFNLHKVDIIYDKIGYIVNLLIGIIIVVLLSKYKMSEGEINLILCASIIIFSLVFSYIYTIIMRRIIKNKNII